MPGVVSGETDVLPAERRDVLEIGWIVGSRLCKRIHRTFQVHGVPERDGGDYQVEPACPVALVLKGSVSDLAETIEEDGAGERIPGLSFI